MKSREELLRHEPPPCSCDVCQHMCRLPCQGDVEDMTALIDAGYANRLSLDYLGYDTDDGGTRYVWMLVPALKGEEGKRTGIQRSSLRGCTFLGIQGLPLCQLHTLKLKPLEGRLAHHHPMLRKPKDIVQMQSYIRSTWDTPEGAALIARWKTLVHYQE